MLNEFLKRLRSGQARREIPDIEIDCERPWGGYIVLPEGVERPKLLSFDGETSLQSHRSKNEIYVIGAGTAAVYRGSLRLSVEGIIANLEKTVVQAGDVLKIPCGTIHAVVNLGDQPLLMVDGAYGTRNLLGLRTRPREDDIIRYYDKGGRTDIVPGVTPLPSEFNGYSIHDLVPICRGRRSLRNLK